MNHTIRILSGGVVTTLAGSPGIPGSADGSPGLFNSPRGIAADSSGNVYVADTLNSTVRKITAGGVVSTFAGLAGNPGSNDGTGSAARFNQPAGIAVDSSGNVYVGDTLNQTIRKITPAGVVTTLAGLPGAASFADVGVSGAGLSGGLPEAFPRSVRPRALPVPSGSMPYSAGRTTVMRITDATIRAVTVAVTIFAIDGTST